VRLGVFPPKNESFPELKDDDLVRILYLIEAQLINRDVITVVESKRMKEIWKTRGQGQAFPDVYDSRQLLQYGKVFQINHGLLSGGVLEGDEITLTARIADGETAALVASATESFLRGASTREYKPIIERMVDSLLLDLGYQVNQPPEFVTYEDLMYARIGEKSTMTIVAEDKDNDSVLLFIRNLDGGQLRQLGDGIGVFEYAPPHELAGETVIVNVYATDGRSEVSKSIRVHIRAAGSRTYLPSKRTYGFGLWLGLGQMQICNSCCGELITAFSAGAFGRLFVAKNFSIQPEVCYSLRGTQGNLYDCETGEPTGRRYEYDLQYMDIQLLGVLGGSRTAVVRFKILGGVCLGINTVAEYRKIDRIAQTEEYSFEANTDLGVTVGLGLEYGGFGSGKKMITLEARGYFGFRRIVSGVPPDPGATMTKGKSTGYVFVLGVGI
jgi:hypothetical protein